MKPHPQLDILIDYLTAPIVLGGLLVLVAGDVWAELLRKAKKPDEVPP